MASLQLPPGARREIVVRALHDFANIGYATVVSRATYNGCFVAVPAGADAGLHGGSGTLLWTRLLVDITVAVGYLSGGDHRLAILSTTEFFIRGPLSLLGIDERRGRRAARERTA